MSEFSDRPFVAGSLRGVRAFDVDALGRLVGVAHKQVWRPGENAAECRKETATRGRYPIWSTLPWLTSLRYEMVPADANKPVSLVHAGREAAKLARERSNHRPGSLSCTCGFYAYFDTAYDNPYDDSPGRIRALVDGYGVVTVGSRGFRAEKAKIVALIISKGRRDHMTERVVANYAPVPVFTKRRDALEQFPLVGPPPLTPELDPDFWTRAS